MSDSSWVSTYVDYNGFKVTVTQEGKTAEEALNVLIELLNGTDAKPFLDRNNVMSLTDAIPTTINASVTTKPIQPSVPTEQMIDGAFSEDGTRYLGIKPGKIEDILENDSYHVVVDSYSYDGTWVNFYSGNDSMSAAGHYYATKVGASIFDEMFGWSPQVVEKALLGRQLKLYIVGVKGKNTDKVYQNIKGVE